MRTWVAAVFLALVCGQAGAQESEWNDPTRRLSFDLAGTGWVAVGRDSPSRRVILYLGRNGFNAPKAPINRICMLDYLHQPTDREITQPEANHALQLSAQEGRAKAEAAGKLYDEVLISHEGVDVRESQNVEPNPATDEPMNRIRWNFVLSADRAMDFMGLVCAADQSLGPDAVTELRAIMRRLRIAEVARP